MKEFKLKDILISISIVLVTILYFLDIYIIPEGLETINILGVQLGSFGFHDLSDFVYFLKMKLLILFFSIIWYFTCKYWWKPAILFIVILELFKLFSLFNSKNKLTDEVEYLISLPITIPLFILLFFLWSKINNFRLSNEVRDSLDKEIDEVFFMLREDKIYGFEELKKKILKTKNKKFKNSETYIKELNSIRNEFYKL